MEAPAQEEEGPRISAQQSLGEVGARLRQSLRRDAVASRAQQWASVLQNTATGFASKFWSRNDTEASSSQRSVTGSKQSQLGPLHRHIEEMAEGLQHGHVVVDQAWLVEFTETHQLYMEACSSQGVDFSMMGSCSTEDFLQFVLLHPKVQAVLKGLEALDSSPPSPSGPSTIAGSVLSDDSLLGNADHSEASREASFDFSPKDRVDAEARAAPVSAASLGNSSNKPDVDEAAAKAENEDRFAAEGAGKAEAAAIAEEVGLAAEASAKSGRDRVAAEAAAEAKEAAKAEDDRLEAEAAAKAEEDRTRAEAAAKVETARLAAEAGAKAEADRIAAEVAANVETDRLAAEAAAKAKEDRMAEEAESKVVEDRLAAQMAAKAEENRIAAEATAIVEEDRLAAEAAAKAGAYRLASEAAAKSAEVVAARAEEDRLAAEAAANVEQDRIAAEAAAKAEEASPGEKSAQDANPFAANLRSTRSFTEPEGNGDKELNAKLQARRTRMAGGGAGLSPRSQRALAEAGDNAGGVDDAPADGKLSMAQKMAARRKRLEQEPEGEEEF